jgi:hypothetical protein
MTRKTRRRLGEGEEEEGRRQRDDMTLHNKKYHAKKQFIISFSQVFSISLSFKSTHKHI